MLHHGYESGCAVQAIPGTDNFRYNYWGYSTGAFFAPMTRYSQAAADGKSGQHIINEFKLLVRECHKRGIEVIMDVVFNHTSEGNEKGPVLSMRCVWSPFSWMWSFAARRHICADKMALAIKAGGCCLSVYCTSGKITDSLQQHAEYCCSCLSAAACAKNLKKSLLLMVKGLH